MTSTPTAQLSELGVSIWLDDLNRHLIQSGKLEDLAKRGLRGVTSNPKILDKAIREGQEYEEPIEQLAARGHRPQEIYEALAIEDVIAAADILRPYFREGLPHDGFVSLEVSPKLAHDTEATIHEARRLWHAVNRPNVLIKVPATKAGVPAIRTLISEGVNINVTLLFSLERYREVAEAYIGGIEERFTSGEPAGRPFSVASFFLSRIDVLLNPQLDQLIEAGGEKGKIAAQLRGHIAISSAKLAYGVYKSLFTDTRFRRLATVGAQPQRLLWGSTSTKGPDARDVKYVEALIGPDTINTLPFPTLEAFLDHGEVRPRLEEGIERAGQNLHQLAEIGIDIQQATQQLEDEGVDKFVSPFEDLLSTLAERAPARS